MEMEAWTKGQSDSLIRITAPARDKGNGTLKKGSKMWTFNPKVNRVITLPPAMMSQSWMGSDFSNNDLAKTDRIIKDYTHTIIATEKVDGITIYTIRSMPHPDAPVVWGMQRLKIREDHIIISQEFFDEDLGPVKIMTASHIKPMGGRLFPTIWRMKKTDAGDEYTELQYLALEFKETLPERIFTQANLKKPRR